MLRCTCCASFHLSSNWPMNRPDRVAQLAKHWASIVGLGLIPTMVSRVFQLAQSAYKLRVTIGGPIQCVVSYRDQCVHKHTYTSLYHKWSSKCFVFKESIFYFSGICFVTQNSTAIRQCWNACTRKIWNRSCISTRNTGRLCREKSRDGSNRKKLKEDNSKYLEHSAPEFWQSWVMRPVFRLIVPENADYLIRGQSLLETLRGRQKFNSVIDPMHWRHSRSSNRYASGKALNKSVNLITLPL